MSTPDNYRSLFEGSQASLADMAARQAQALARVGRLRSAIVTVLRKNFMSQSAQAEANLGSRLSEIDDEILLAYLDAFTAAASRGDQRATLQALREAIVAAGIPLRGDEPLLWVGQIHQHRQRSRAVAASADAPTRDTTEPRRPPLLGRDRETTTNTPAGTSAARPAVSGTENVAPLTEPSVRSSAPLPVEDYWRWDEADNADPSAEPVTDTTELGTLFADVIEPSRWNSDLGAVAANHDRWSPSPLQARPEPAAAPAPPPAVAPETWETGDRPASARVTTPAPSETAHDDASGDQAAIVDDGAPIAKSNRRTPTKAAGRAAAGTATPRKRNVRKTATTPSDSGEPAATADDETAATEPPAVSAVTPEATTTGPATTLGDAGFVDTDVVDTGDDRGAPAPAVAPPAHASQTGLGQPMRPELFPGVANPKRKPKQTRVHATTGEDNPTLLSAASAPTELTDGMRHALLAAASIPRPVFARDLVSIAGSLAMVDAWESECRANVNSSPVRFVAPKSRHRLRGCLVAVDRAEARAVDWWHQAVKRYRAGRLYELGVLLHRVGDEIVSFTLEDQVAVFRLNTPRGLVGIVVVLDTRTTGDDTTLNAVAEHLERLLAERLTMIAVLTTSAEPGSLEGLVTDVEQLARDRGWQPAVPVIAARSWEYADDRGSSAVMVLGQG